MIEVKDEVTLKSGVLVMVSVAFGALAAIVLWVGVPRLWEAVKPWLHQVTG